MKNSMKIDPSVKDAKLDVVLNKFNQMIKLELLNYSSVLHHIGMYKHGRRISHEEVYARLKLDLVWSLMNECHLWTLSEYIMKSEHDDDEISEGYY
jgi:hypothetical protein